MKKIGFILLLFVSIVLTSCQKVTRSFGGSTTIRLEKGEKLVEATWKEDNLWYLVEPMDNDYTPKTKVFKESSLWGAMEGKVIFVEQR